jgi:hypothetical protein
MKRRPLLFLDIEVGPNYFLIGVMDEKNIIDTIEVYGKYSKALTVSDKKRIERYLRAHTIITYNGNTYDLPIIYAALQGFNLNEIFEMSKDIVSNNLPRWKTFQEYNLHPDTELNTDHIDIKEPAPAVRISLKLYGARLNAPKLQDLPYDYDAPLTPSEFEELKLYNENDLVVTKMLYDGIKDRIDLRYSMSEKYKQDLRSKSDAQIAEAVILSELLKHGVNVAKPIMPRTVEYTAPKCISFKTDTLVKLLRGLDKQIFNINQKDGAPLLPKWLGNTPIKIGSMEYKVRMGGLHSTEKSVSIEPPKGSVMRTVDVASYYPSMILEFKFYPPNLTSKFLTIYGDMKAERLEAKSLGIVTINEGLKIVLNSSFGKLGSKFSKLYAPDLLLQVTLTGQLMLLMLIETLHSERIVVVSANTDGIEYICQEDRIEEIEALIYDWELTTGMDMEHKTYRSLHSRDVNDYVAVYDGDVKAIGVYKEPTLKKNSEYPIVFEAIREFLLNGTPLEDTILNNTDITGFLTSRTVNGGAVWADTRSLEDSPEMIDLVANGKKITKAAEKRNDLFRGLQVCKKGTYLGKVCRWYYGVDGASIHYKTTGNMVPKSLGAIPAMELPDILPDNLDYDKYIELAIGHLEDLGVTYQ